ncbi:glutamate--tRNA ligase [Candidatus Nitrosacidococcus tergens]|uniref:Glutamate--tRNA ligase n=1 Tax=Candidatus Nitrosacidococcus tergens TaxID=553981 RepID=A0A7G1Q8F3_9GAMM|nr:glutamate--tRNA ligase [Candidatus Nitrosacidococcus tergens]CAB1275181.1 Glutamate-tRNA ligase [Candidatus Nitrosacidococcus tergens]
MIKTRFAPSPSGLLHLGNVRTALFNVLFASAHQSIFLLRIEDTDQERSGEGYITTLIKDLKWLDLAWQEGVEVGGSYSPYRQSERTQIYQSYFDQLENKKLAYPCFCSPQELKQVRKRQLASGQPPRYPGTCARLNSDEINNRQTKGIKPTLRFRVPDSSIIEFTDLVRGEQRFTAHDIGDFIIRRADSSPAFFFSNAIDDSLMEVTHVLRGEDHLTNTPRQILLLQALQLSIPQYAHIGLIIGHDGAPLSKRHGSRSIAELREEGYLPLALCNYLARLGHHFEDTSFLSLATLASQFKLENLGKAPARFDESQLIHWQREGLIHSNAEALKDWLGNDILAQIPENQYEQFIEAIRPNILFPKDTLRWITAIFDEKLNYKDESLKIITQTDSSFFTQALKAIDSCGLDFKKFITELKNTTETKGKVLFQPLRAALTGELDGPELALLFPLIGVEKIHQRLTQCLNISGK